MKAETIRNHVQSFLNGNIDDFKRALKSCSKRDLISFIFVLHYETGKDYNVVLDTLEGLLR